MLLAYQSWESVRLAVTIDCAVLKELDADEIRGRKAD
jgi:hypothetical protein